MIGTDRAKAIIRSLIGREKSGITKSMPSILRHNATAALALAGREPRHVGVQIGHAHHQRKEHANHADQADKNGARQEKQFHRNQRHPHHEDADPLDAGQAGDVAAEEVQHQRRDADRAKHAEAGGLELDV